MRKFYRKLADYLKYHHWGRKIVNHVNRHPRFYDNFEALYTALLIALIIKGFFFDAFKIPSSSMEDTLEIGDRIFVNKFIYNFTDVEIGDIVVFRTKGMTIYDPEKPYYIKRVVGLPGDAIEIKRGYLFRNGEKVTEPVFFLENYYFPYFKRTKFKVPEGEYFMFGDNSAFSSDSRAWGGVPQDNVVGRAAIRFWPLHRIGLLYGDPPENADALDKERKEMGY